MRDLGWGDPADESYRAKHVVTLERYGVDLAVRREAAPLFARTLDLLVAEKGARWFTRRADDWGYAYRPIRGSTELSYHAWGLAIDVDAVDNPSVGPGAAHHTTMPADAAAIAGRQGQVWGGSWHDPYDPMHFEQHGSRVECLQRSLNLHGFALRVDGDKGPKTTAALRRFQQQHRPDRVHVTGQMNHETWAVLIPPEPQRR